MDKFESDPEEVVSQKKWDSDFQGLGRGLVAFLFWLLSFIGAIFLPSWWLTFGAWLLVVGLTWNLFLIYIPAIKGAALLNIFTGPPLSSLGSGLRLKLPWEKAVKVVPLEIITKQHEETYAAGTKLLTNEGVDTGKGVGDLVTVKWSFQYHPDIRRLGAFVTVDESTIDNGFTDVFGTTLSDMIADMDAEEVRTSVKELSERVLEEFEKIRVNGNRQWTMKKKLEDKYGVNFFLFNIADADFSLEYQRARSGKAQADKLGESADSLVKKLGISGDVALNAVLADQGKSDHKSFNIPGLSDAVSSFLGRK